MMTRSEERLNPHNHLTRSGEPPLDRWHCQYCHTIGSYDELLAVACAYEYPPCAHCGQTPECAPDCSGIAAALSSPDVHVVGIDRTRCMGPRNGEELGGPRCQKPATHTTYLGRRCVHHAEEIRQALRNPNTLVSVLKGRAHTEEEISRKIVELPKGERPS